MHVHLLCTVHTSACDLAFVIMQGPTSTFVHTMVAQVHDFTCAHCSAVADTNPARLQDATEVMKAVGSISDPSAVLRWPGREEGTFQAIGEAPAPVNT